MTAVSQCYRIGPIPLFLCTQITSNLLSVQIEGILIETAYVLAVVPPISKGIQCVHPTLNGTFDMDIANEKVAKV